MDRDNERGGRGNLDSDWHTREFTSQMYGQSERDRETRDREGYARGNQGPGPRTFDRDERQRDLSFGTPTGSGRQGQREAGEGNPRYGARDSHLGRGDWGYEGNSGTEGTGRDGAQGYGLYRDQNREVSGRDLSDNNAENQRRYGIQGGGYGVYDISGRGAEGYQRGSSGSYDDKDFGTRHWGRGEYKGSGPDSSYGSGESHSLLERVGEKVGETVGRFFGKGPKGYQRSDDRIREDVSEELYIHRDIDATDIEVLVSQGVVTLEGRVDSRRTKRAVEDVVDRVAGVRDVINHLRTNIIDESTGSGVNTLRSEESRDEDSTLGGEGTPHH